MVNMRNAHYLWNNTSKLGGCAIDQGLSHCPFILDTQISSGANPHQNVLWTKYQQYRFSTNISISFFSIIPPMHHIHSFICEWHHNTATVKM